MCVSIVQLTEGHGVVSVNLKLRRDVPASVLSVLLSSPVRNRVWEAGDLHQAGQTGRGTGPGVFC